MNGARAVVAPAIAEPIVRVSVVDRSRTWYRIIFAAAACVTLLDAALLQRKHAVFTGGFLASHQFGTLADSVAFLMASALLNTTIVAPVTLVALVIGRRFRLRPRAAQSAAFCAAVLPLAIADFLNYQVWSYLGDAFDFHVMFALTGHRLAEVFAVTAPLMSRPLFVAAVALTGIVGVIVLLQRFDRRDAQSVVLPSAGAALRRCLVLAFGSSVVVTAVAMTSDAMGFGLRWTPSGQLFTTVLDRLSDVDRDGYGLLKNPRDAAPFKASIYPYAVDVPGNGIDEDGLGGDLPLNWPGYRAAAPPTSAWPERPPVILFVLESVRADAIGSSFNGRRVTPVMDGLAAEGMKVGSAWSHAGSTVLSRYHLLTGSLVDGRGDSTLLDDFKHQGYTVAYFSGQNDDFGSAGLDYGRVDKFYDARQDIANRYSTSTTPGSLAVPLKVVEGRIGEYLAGRQEKAPLFLYVNFHDTHYPYNHAGLENLLGVELLAASLISPARRAELSLTYLNATANVDRAIGRVIQAVEAHAKQRPAVVIVGDHGESLFEQGILGHGFALNDAQTRVPLIIRGLPVNIETPFGLADVRRAVTGAMTTGAGSNDRPVQRTSGARVFQFLGTLETPSQIGWMTSDGSFTYDFRSERVGLWDSAVAEPDLLGGPRRIFEELVYTWESMLLIRSQGRLGRP
ncbi:MAG: sulfatase-like hydrolase/transferase [Vicinamibacterales bacterium]